MLIGELAVYCSTLLDLPRQTHGLHLMRDELVVPRDRRLTLNGADDIVKKLSSTVDPIAVAETVDCGA